MRFRQWLYLRITVATIGMLVAIGWPVFWVFQSRMFDQPEWAVFFLNGWVTALYGGLICFSARSTRNLIAGAVMIPLGLWHGVWVLPLSYLTALGLSVFRLVAGHHAGDELLMLSLVLTTGLVFAVPIIVSARTSKVAVVQGVVSVLAILFTVLLWSLAGNPDRLAAGIFALHLVIGSTLYAAVLMDLIPMLRRQVPKSVRSNRS
jgi:hypothetical protein